MGPINDLLNRVVEFNNGLTSGEYIRQAVEDNEEFIVELNSEDQLYEEGINSLGVFIADYAPYSDVTKQIKAQKGQPYNRVTLRDTGDFERSFYLHITNEQFKIDASDMKRRELMLSYGDEIMGLTEENKFVVAWEFIFPALMQERKRLIYGK